MLLRPRLLEPPDGRGRQPAGVLAEQCDQGFLKVAGRQALEVEDRDQHFEAFRAARVRRQNRRRKADALRTFTGTVTYTRAAHGDRTDAGHDLALGQMPVAHQPLATVIGQLVGMAGEQDCDFGLHRLPQQRSRAVAQNLGQRVRKSSWLAELENVSVGHGVPLLRWRSGGVKHPHDTPPYPFMPSPTFAYSSPQAPLLPWLAIRMAQRRLTNQLSERRRPGVDRGHGGRLRPDHRQNARRCLWLRLENSTPSNIKPATVVSASGALLAHDTECPALTIGRWNGANG